MRPVFLGLAMSWACVLSSQTFNKDIAPILHQYCAPCHRPGEAAPFSLLDYSDVKAHAQQIAQVTKTRFMPPWKPAPGRGEFEGERRLSDRQIAIIQEWVARGAPEGDASHRSRPPVFAEGWQLGTPDLVLTLEAAYVLPPDGQDVFRNFVLPVPLAKRRYVRAIEIRPGAKTVVHHANVLLDRDRSLRRRDNQDGSPGFPGMDIQLENRSFEPDSHFLFWKPGTTVMEEPADMAWQLDPGTDLILNMHLRPSGKPEPIRPSIGLYFTETPPQKQPMLLQMENDGAIDIPAGRSGFVVTDTLRFPVDAAVLAVYPHGHYLARDMRAFATLPDGSVRWLIHIPDWDLNWQAVYRYQTPVMLPKGSVVTMRYTYDNSGDNPRNPNHPPRRVRAGDRSEDEMAHLWLQVLPRPQQDGKERRTLYRALMGRRLERYPGDFQAHFSLGSLAQEDGLASQAEEHYRSALKAEPRSSAAYNSLGSALLELNRVDEAESCFRQALVYDSQYGHAHYNLARVLLSANKVPDAIRHLQEAIRIDANDVAAMSDLGAALSMTGRSQQGLALLREVVQKAPEFFLGRFNLGQALAAAGLTKEAREQFEAALRLKPGDQDVLDALKGLGSR